MATIYLRFIHTVDLYSESEAVNNAGQLMRTWTIETTGEKCMFIPRYDQIRTDPSYEERAMDRFFFPNTATIGYNHRIYNVKDRFGNVLEAGPFEIMELLPQPGYNGRLHHYVLMARRLGET